MPKRGTDHTWQLIKFLGDIAIYAKCKCGFYFNCSRPESGESWAKQVPSAFYAYCPKCGARKKWRTTDIKKLNRYPWE